MFPGDKKMNQNKSSFIKKVEQEVELFKHLVDGAKHLQVLILLLEIMLKL